MNELLFFLHMGVIFLCTLGALKLGKESLSSWICLQAILANFFVLKQIPLFGFHVTCSDAFAVGGVLGLNLLREYHGNASAKKTITTCFYAMLFFAVLSKIHLLYIPTLEDTSHASYKLLLSPAPRLLIASLLVFFIVQKIDLKLFNRLKSFKALSSSTISNFISVSICELLDTILFSLIGLYGIVSSISDIILVSFFIKVAVIVFLSPIIWIAKRYVPLKENFL